MQRKSRVARKSTPWAFHLFCILGLSYSFTQAETSELIQTSLIENGQNIRLELVIAKPTGDGPFPTLVFNHGSTRDRQRYKLI